MEETSAIISPDAKFNLLNLQMLNIPLRVKNHYWIHTNFDFDENDKIDEVNQYLDKAAINEVMKK